MGPHGVFHEVHPPGHARRRNQSLFPGRRGYPADTRVSVQDWLLYGGSFIKLNFHRGGLEPEAVFRVRGVVLALVRLSGYGRRDPR
jgi:hypothetical protein